MDLSWFQLPSWVIRDRLPIKVRANCCKKEESILHGNCIRPSLGFSSPHTKVLDFEVQADHFADWNQDAKNPIKLIWQSLVATVAEIFTNHNHEQIGASVPFSGRIDNPETSTWRAIISMLGNAFIKALKPGIDDELTLSRSQIK